MHNLINATIEFVKTALKNAESGHDWLHIYRVWLNAKQINQTESGDKLIVELAALLHDIADAKFHNGDENKGANLAYDFLSTQKLDNNSVEHVCEIIKNISFKGGIESGSFSSPEFLIVQDADRLDAMGALGIARTFNYGGYKNREIFNPDIPPIDYKSSTEYRNSAAPTINHFYEKLLKLKDLINTPTGKKIAEQRHEYMLSFLKQFYAEWPSKEDVERFLNDI